ncbi:hypothetical protein LZZ85_27965 [Terrimonas sp. NA20]|uniref:DUF4476 domain-containing protein n=1 Tax=Terrimonas ginsenosidimutans TaxID=2908004 RepID=A0ABS9L0R5_9BACT|nr:hypothetical protein [Terrimonas ginsenosidimutans]MCG2618169.1 hypothetical protein [Terrimonas ginsenosidimutans]
MKKIAALLIILFWCQAGFTQQAYFVYLQAEGAQPFFLKMNEEVHSSNSSGYLILSRLKDSSYTFSIGFPQNKWPEQTFSVAIGARDKGFLLKKEDDKSWSLADLQTDQRIAAGTPANRRSVRTEPKEVSAFTDILSKATDDPSLKERVVPVKAVAEAAAEPKKETAAAVTEPARTEVAVSTTENIPAKAIPDSAAASVAQLGIDEKKAEEKKNELKDLTARDTLVRRPPANLPVPEKVIAAADEKRDSVVEKKTELVMADQAADTVSQAISVGKKEESVPAPIEEKKTPPVVQKNPDSLALAVAPVKKEELAPVEVETKKQEPVAVSSQEYRASSVKRRTESSTSEGFGVTYVDEYPDGKKDTIQIFIPNPKQVQRNVPPPQEDGVFLPMDSEAKDLTPAKKEKSGRNDCSSMASETDYLKLRKKMVATDGDDAMLAAAKKIFKTKCFTTEQLKNLGTLFLNDAGRYNFFDAAYLSVSDSGNFSSLETELKDPYYISRFKAMLR